jgi:hypothetical protein
MSQPGKGNGVDELYSAAVRIFASLILVFGIVILGVTLAHGGGPASTGTLLGVGFTVLGCARLWLSFK